MYEHAIFSSNFLFLDFPPIFSSNFLFLDFPLEEDVLRQKYIRLKIFSFKFSTKRILMFEVINAPVDALRAGKKESYYLKSSKKMQVSVIIFLFFCLADVSQEKYVMKNTSNGLM